MAIRLSGMVSGLDTDAIVQELVKAYSTKKETYEKAQTKLSWKQDAWKELNTKIYGFYSTTLSELRYTSAFNKKSTSVSDESKVTVTASSSVSNSTQSLQIEQLAKSGYLTGAQLGSKGTYTTSTTLGELGVSGSSTISVQIGDGVESKIQLTEDMTMSQLISAFKGTGINANFDTANQRIFLSSTTTGADANFKVTADSQAGLSALSALGLFTGNDTEKAQYEEWAKYDGVTYTTGADGKYSLDLSALSTENTTSLQSLFDKIGDARKEAAEAEIESMQKDYETTEEKRNTLSDSLDSLRTDLSAIYADYETLGAKKTDVDEMEARIAELNVLIGDDTATAEQKAEAQAELDTLDLDAAKADLEAAETASGLSEEDLTKLYTLYAEKVSEEKSYDDLGQTLTDIQNNINTKQAYITDGSLESDVAKELVDSTNESVQILSQYDSYGTSGKLATKVEGQNAIIYLNDAKFENDSNSITVNGLTINAKATTVNADGSLDTIMITTSDDIQAKYDMIKDFISEYNDLIKEMDTLYNASSAKGYEPLTDDEKDAMSDTEIEKWEKKIKDSLLRRDSTLDSIISSMKNSMSTRVDINGKSYSLSSFGINTLSYFNAKDNEKGLYHIDGNKDDSATSGNEDQLMAALTNDPDATMEFFNTLAKNLYGTLDSKMKSTSLSSAYTIYNDKQLQSEYDDYDDIIEKWEDKIADMEDKYYKQFSAMETALAKLQSNTSSISSLLGSGS